MLVLNTPVVKCALFEQVTTKERLFAASFLFYCGWGQTCLSMPKMMTNSVWALSQELWSYR